MRRLLRYTDRERVLNVLDVNAIEDLPNQFFANAEGQTACRVTVDWLGIRAGLEASIEILAKGRSSHLTAEAFSEVKKHRSTEAVLYVLEFLPEVVDSAIASLYLEAFVKVSVDSGRTHARSTVATLVRMEYDAKVRRLGIQEGPRRRFRHKSQYETALKKAMNALLIERRDITQESVAEKLTQESEDSLDVRVIRRWNKEFGVNWSTVKRAAQADKS